MIRRLALAALLAPAFVCLAGSPSFADGEVISVPDVTTYEGTEDSSAGHSYATFTAHLSAPSADAVSFDVHADDGDDDEFYTADLTVTFPAGATSAPFRIMLHTDSVYEPTESFTVLLSNPVGATLASDHATLTLLNKDYDNTHGQLGCRAAVVQTRAASGADGVTLAGAHQGPLTQVCGTERVGAVATRFGSGADVLEVGEHKTETYLYVGSGGWSDFATSDLTAVDYRLAYGAWAIAVGETHAAVAMRCDRTTPTVFTSSSAKMPSVTLNGSRISLPQGSDTAYQRIALGAYVLEFNKVWRVPAVDAQGRAGEIVTVAPLLVTRPDGSSWSVGEAVASRFGDTCVV